MADPLSVDCPKNVWTKVATNVTSGAIYIKEFGPVYNQTIRVTGNPAPVEADLNLEGVPLGDKRNSISETVAIDVYIWCNKDGGRVRVDLP